MGQRRILKGNLKNILIQIKKTTTYQNLQAVAKAVLGRKFTLLTLEKKDLKLLM